MIWYSLTEDCRTTKNKLQLNGPHEVLKASLGIPEHPDHAHLKSYHKFVTLTDM